MPEVTEIDVPAGAAMGVTVEGATSAWPGAVDTAVLPDVDVFNRQRRYIDVFSRGGVPFPFSATANAPWVVLTPSHGVVRKEQRVWVSVDWSKAPKEASEAEVKIRGTGEDVTVRLKALNPSKPTKADLHGFVEANGYVSIEAEHYIKKIDAGAVRWEKIADYGRTLSAMMVSPVTAASVTPPQGSPCLEYQMYLFDSGKVDVEAIVAPTLNFVPGRGLRYAISFDDQPPQVVDVLAQNSQHDWEESVKDSVRKSTSTHTLDKAGVHTLKFWMLDPGLVLEKIVVDLGGVQPSYLGPPESYRAVASVQKAPPKTSHRSKRSRR